MTPKFFKSPKEFRKWLEINHATAAELWVGYHKKHTGKPSLTWPESVDQALCFGWIDGLRKSIDEERYMIRFTPRKDASIWSAVNIKRVAELTKLGLMHSAGLAKFKKRDPQKAELYSFERKNATLPREFQKEFEANAKAWKFFQSMPPSYRTPATWWVMSAKKEETRARRLALLIADSQAGGRIAAMDIGKKR
jgi:uncharacterized protein YdeI (YjbR/CyaY-like superfamily)